MSYDNGKLAESLKRVYASTSEGSNPPEKYRRCRILGGSGTKISFTGSGTTFEAALPAGDIPTLKIIDDGMDALDAFGDELLKDDDFRDIIGRDAIESQVLALLQLTKGCLPSGDVKDVVRSQVIKPLRDEIRPWHSYVPIVNLVVKAQLRFGDVLFMSRETAGEESRRFIEGHRFGGDDAEDREQQKHAIVDDMQASAQQTAAFAMVSLPAHSKRVVDVAADKALLALNILRSYTHLFYAYSDKALIGLPSELSDGSWSSVSLGQDERHAFIITHEDRGPVIGFVLDTEKIDHLTANCHLGLVQEILDKPSNKRNSLESALVQAFQSLGRGIVAPTIDMRFLACAIALESILVPDDRGMTTQYWSDRLAMVLERNPARRVEIIKRAKKLYDLRSRIVHAAYSGVADQDARLMEKWAINVILSTLGRHKEFSSHEEFCRKIDPREIGLGTGSDK